MIRGLKLFGLFSRISILNELQYRANFFLQLFQSSLSLATGLIVIGVVFSYTPTLGGWTQAELLAIYGVFYLLGGILRTIIIPNMWVFMEDVREGRLDFTLTKPEDAQLLISVRQFAVWRLVEVILGVIVLAVAITLAFWFVRVWELMEMLQSIYQAGRWPVGIYPEWLRMGLTYLIPVAFAVTVPAEALTGRLTPETLAGTLVFTVVMAFVSRKVWFFGLKYYAGA